MEFWEVVGRRRMVRRYAPDPLPDGALDRILDAARRAPSAGFSQGQSYVVVTDPALRHRVAALVGEERYVARGFAPWISSAPALVVLCTSEQTYQRRYAQADKLGPDHPLAWRVPYWHLDAGCALMALLLAAVDEALGAGFLGLHKGDEEEGLRALLGIPADVQPIGIVTVGKPLPDRGSASVRRGRLPADEQIHRERWGSAASPRPGEPAPGPTPPVGS